MSHNPSWFKLTSGWIVSLTRQMIQLAGWGSTNLCLVPKHDDLGSFKFCNEIRHFFRIQFWGGFEEEKLLKDVNDDFINIVKTMMIILRFIGMMKILILQRKDLLHLKNIPNKKPIIFTLFKQDYLSSWQDYWFRWKA